MTHHTIQIRVRYPEADPMGYLHHSVYLQYFEMGRIELLRKRGHSYADLEKSGVFFVVAKVEVKYKSPARFDDLLELTTKVAKQTAVRIDHQYELRREGILVAEGATTIACVDREGQLQQIPEIHVSAIGINRALSASKQESGLCGSNAALCRNFQANWSRRKSL